MTNVKKCYKIIYIIQFYTNLLNWMSNYFGTRNDLDYLKFFLVFLLKCLIFGVLNIDFRILIKLFHMSITWYIEQILTFLPL